MPYGKIKMGKDKPRKPGDRLGIMPVKPGKPGIKRPGTGYGPGVKPSPLTPRNPGGSVRPRPPIGRKPYPGNDGGPVRPSPKSKPKKTNTIGSGPLKTSTIGSGPRKRNRMGR